MKTARIVEVVANTKTLEGTPVGLAAYLAQKSGYRDCVADVQAFWVKQGGTVDDEAEALAAAKIG